PSNILVKQQENQAVAKVIDFGLAKALGGRLADATFATVLGTIVGTLEYMSPEQTDIGRHDIDTRTDVYSLGAVLYELLTGATPFTALVVAGVVVSVWMAVRASRAEQEARSVNDFLHKELLAQASATNQAGPNTKPDPNLTVRTVLDRAAARVEGKFATQPA